VKSEVYGADQQEQRSENIFFEICVGIEQTFGCERLVVSRPLSKVVQRFATEKLRKKASFPPEKCPRRKSNSWSGIRRSCADRPIFPDKICQT